jgi:Fur family transcriptional regulator, ferric uptake regulator
MPLGCSSNKMRRYSGTKTVRRRTNQRRVILEELMQLRSHLTADEWYRIVRLRLPKVCIATVYRNLEVLFSEGFVQKMDIPGTQRRFDGDTNNHLR